MYTLLMHARSMAILHGVAHSTCSYHMRCCFGIAKMYRPLDALLQSHTASHAMVFLFPEGKGWLAPPLKTFHLAPARGSRAPRAPRETSLEKRFVTLDEMSRKSEKHQYARDSKKDRHGPKGLSIAEHVWLFHDGRSVYAVLLLVIEQLSL